MHPWHRFFQISIPQIEREQPACPLTSTSLHLVFWHSRSISTWFRKWMKFCGTHTWFYWKQVFKTQEIPKGYNLECLEGYLFHHCSQLVGWLHERQGGKPLVPLVSSSVLRKQQYPRVWFLEGTLLALIKFWKSSPSFLMFTTQVSNGSFSLNLKPSSFRKCFYVFKLFDYFFSFHFLFPCRAGKEGQFDLSIRLYNFVFESSCVLF